MKLTEKQRKRLKKSLMMRKMELEHHLHEQHRELAASTKETGQELSVNDNHPADHGTEVFTGSRDRLLLRRSEQQHEDVLSALERLDNGAYGHCEVCAASIPYARLEAIPWTTRCIGHAEAAPAVRPALEPAPRREYEGIGFDGEDAWHIVAGWGNASINEDEADLLDDNDGYVEPIESFLATDLYGTTRIVIRNEQYHKYMEQGEGDYTLDDATSD